MPLGSNDAPDHSSRPGAGAVDLDALVAFLAAQFFDANSTMNESMQIMRQHYLRACLEILTGLVEVTKLQLEKAERTAPRVEKITIE